MKFEIDFPDDQIKEQLDGVVKLAVKNTVTGYSIQEQIKKQLKEMLDRAYNQALDFLILEEMKNSEQVKAMVKEVMTKKIKARLDKLMKEGE